MNLWAASFEQLLAWQVALARHDDTAGGVLPPAMSSSASRWVLVAQAHHFLAALEPGQILNVWPTLQNEPRSSSVLWRWTADEQAPTRTVPTAAGAIHLVGQGPATVPDAWVVRWCQEVLDSPWDEVASPIWDWITRTQPLDAPANHWESADAQGPAWRAALPPELWPLYEAQVLQNHVAPGRENALGRVRL